MFHMFSEVFMLVLYALCVCGVVCLVFSMRLGCGDLFAVVVAWLFSFLSFFITIIIYIIKDGGS